MDTITYCITMLSITTVTLTLNVKESLMADKCKLIDLLRPHVIGVTQGMAIFWLINELVNQGIL